MWPFLERSSKLGRMNLLQRNDFPAPCPVCLFVSREACVRPHTASLMVDTRPAPLGLAIERAGGKGGGGEEVISKGSDTICLAHTQYGGVRQLEIATYGDSPLIGTAVWKEYYNFLVVMSCT